MSRFTGRIARLEGRDSRGRRPEVTRVFMARDGKVQERIAEARRELDLAGQDLLAIVIRDFESEECEAHAKQA